MAAPQLPPADNNFIAWFVAIGGALGTAAVAARQWFKNNRLGEAGVNAQLDVISMLKEQLDAERARADAATQARDQALDQIRGLRDQVAALSLQVQHLQETIKTSPPVVVTASIASPNQ